MTMTVQEGIKELKKKHKDLYPVWYAQTGQKILVDMLQRGTPKEDSLANIFLIDLTTGEDVGPIPPMLIYGDDKYEKLLKNIHKISPEDQSIEHSILGNESGNGWKVRHTFDASDIYGDSLSHHGIKGQKWGHRNGPPYPLNPEDHSAAEKKAGKSGHFEVGSSDSGASKKNIRDKLYEPAAKKGDEFIRSISQDDLTKTIDRNESKKVDKRAIAADLAKDAVYTVFNPLNAINIGIKGTMSAIARTKTKNFENKRKNNSELDPETGLYKKTEGEYSEKEDLAAVNPGFMNMASNTKNNCVLCTTTYELRQRGYDVTAQLDSRGYNFRDVQRWFPGAKVESTSRRDASGKPLSQKQYVEKTLASFSKYEDGARGNLMVQWLENGGGHSVFWEKKNGKLIIKDSQTGTVYKNPEKLLSQTSVNLFARLDNVEPNIEAIKRECVQ